MEEIYVDAYKVCSCKVHTFFRIH